MATHSSVLAWRIPGTGEPGGLPSMGSHRVGHDWSDLAAKILKVKDALMLWNCMWCWRRFESPSDSKEIKPVNPKGNQSWIFIGRTDAKADAAIPCPPDGKSLLIRKEPEAGKDWRQKEKRASQDEMVGWHHWLNEHHFEQIPGDSEGQGSLAWCSPWVTESDMT